MTTKKSKDLINFLFGESQKVQDADGVADDITSIFEEMEEIEALEVNKAPLERVLKEIEVEGDVKVDELSRELCVCVEGPNEYKDAINKVFDYDNMHKLAQGGWVPAKSGQDDKDNFRIKFIEVSVHEPENNDKDVDLEDLIKKAQEFATTPMKRDNLVDAPKDGIVPSDKNNAPSGKSVKTKIKDSISEGEKLANRHTRTCQKCRGYGVIDLEKQEDGAYMKMGKWVKACPSCEGTGEIVRLRQESAQNLVSRMLGEDEGASDEIFFERDTDSGVLYLLKISQVDLDQALKSTDPVQAVLDKSKVVDEFNYEDDEFWSNNEKDQFSTPWENDVAISFQIGSDGEFDPDFSPLGK